MNFDVFDFNFEFKNFFPWDLMTRGFPISLNF